MIAGIAMQESMLACKLNPAVRDPVRFSQLSEARQTLVRLCQAINYGYIQGLDVRDSDPVFDQPPLAFMDLKLDADEGQRPEADLPDFELRYELCRLLVRLDELKNGRIERIEVRSGIPRRLLFRLPDGELSSPKKPSRAAS
jgi:hypothetical protein